ncbi:hypothetical protein MRB53_018420 [Persea americana]|uniref:Uncharacterized protein n=1 Tax=Persea americana TaxID=3435 RepID=A0ACC2M7E4_PERAE|nr:hypothetical protein MRB53_018420 [Persea americana]
MEGVRCLGEDVEEVSEAAEDDEGTELEEDPSKGEDGGAGDEVEKLERDGERSRVSHMREKMEESKASSSVGFDGNANFRMGLLQTWRISKASSASSHHSCKEVSLLQKEYSELHYPNKKKEYSFFFPSQ